MQVKNRPRTLKKKIEDVLPQDLLSKLTPSSIDSIQSALNDGAKYLGHQDIYFKVNEDKTKIMNSRAEISQADLRLTLIANKLYDRYYFTADYEWLNAKFKNLDHHVFTMALSDGWTVDRGTVIKTVYSKVWPNEFWKLQSTNSGTCYDSTTNSTSWSSLGNSHTPLMYNKYFKGSCTYQAVKSNSSAPNNITLAYGYDKAGKSLSVNIKGNSVSYTSPNGVYKMNKTINFTPIIGG